MNLPLAEIPQPNTAEWITACATVGALFFAFWAFFFSKRQHLEAKERYEKYRRDSSPLFIVPSFPILESIELNVGIPIYAADQAIILSCSPGFLTGTGHEISRARSNPVSYLILENTRGHIKLKGWKFFIPETLTPAWETPEMLGISRIRFGGGLDMSGDNHWIVALPRLWRHQGLRFAVSFETDTGYVDTHLYRVEFIGKGEHLHNAAEIHRINPTSVDNPDQEFRRSDQRGTTKEKRSKLWTR